MEIGAKRVGYHGAERKQILCTVSPVRSFHGRGERVALCWFRLHKGGLNPFKGTKSVRREASCQARPLNTPMDATNQDREGIKGQNMGSVYGGLEQELRVGGWGYKDLSQLSHPFLPKPRRGHNLGLLASLSPRVVTPLHYRGMSFHGGTSIIPEPEKMGLLLTAN